MLAAAVDNYWLTWFPGALLAFFGLLTLIWKGIEQRVEEKRVLRELKLALPAIQAEFSPDHGHSMKDRVEALHAKQDKHQRVMTDHMENDKTAFAKQERFNDRIEATLERIEDKL